MTLLWWHWAVIGFGLILSELLMPAFVLVWFGLGALIVTLLMLIIPEMAMVDQMLFWTGSSLLMVGLWFKVFKRNHHKILIGRGSAQYEGEIGMISEAVAPFKNGKVRFQKPLLGSDQWECVADEAIEVGTRVKILKVEGSTVTVAKV